MKAADLSRASVIVTSQGSCRLPSLLCEELPAWNGLRRSFADPVMLSDDRVLENLLVVEDCCLLNAKYFNFQPEIKPFMRRILTSWMLEVSGNSCSLPAYVVSLFFAFLLRFGTEMLTRDIDIAVLFVCLPPVTFRYCIETA